MDIYSVIGLGHTRNVPLIGRSSELVDGLEPHDQFLPGVLTARVDDDGGRVEGCTRGGGSRVGTGGYYTGYPAEAGFEAYLMNLVLRLVHTAV